MYTQNKTTVAVGVTKLKLEYHINSPLLSAAREMIKPSHNMIRRTISPHSNWEDCW